MDATESKTLAIELTGKIQPFCHRMFWLGMLLLGALLGFLGIMAGNRLNLQSDQPAVEFAPAFEIPLFEGEQRFQLNHYQGQGVVVNFWASWCHPCRQEMAVLESSWRVYRDQGVVFVGVNVWDTGAEAMDFLRQFEVSYPNGPDTGGQVVERFGLQGIPTTLFIAPDGTISRKILGQLTPESLARAVETIIPDQEVK